MCGNMDPAGIKITMKATDDARFPGQFHGTGTRPSNAMRTVLYMHDWYDQWARSGGKAQSRRTK